MRVLQLQQQPEATLQDFAAALASDAGLAAKLLAIANAQMTRSSENTVTAISKVSEAVSLIGLDNLLPLVFGLSLGGMFHKLAMPPTERMAAWRCSLLKGFVAREYALAYAPDVMEEAFNCAVSQDIALSVLQGADRSAWPETLAILSLENDRDRHERERQMYAMDHAELGGQMLEQIGAPGLMTRATAAHHSGVQALAEAAGSKLAVPLHLASLVPHKSFQLGGPLINRLAGVASTLGKISVTDAVETLRRASDEYTRALDDFGDGEETSAAFRDLLQSMSSQVAVSVEAALRISSHMISDLKTREAQLQDAVTDLKQKVTQSDFDGLTKVLTRKGFTDRAERLLDLSNKRGAWCAVGFVDMDNFKRLNDGFGHATGDAALIAVAGRLAGAVKGKGIVGRIGGDEFCFMLVSQAAEFDQREADRLKVAMANLTVTANGEAVTFTTSIGLLSLGMPPCPHSLSAAMQQADELMYNAKKKGKNCCVVGQIGAPALAPGTPPVIERRSIPREDTHSTAA